jgi:hypothetical protein
MVTQHRDRFCSPHYFDISRGLIRNLDMRPVPLESWSSYITIHIKNVQKRVGMWSGRRFWCGLFLESELIFSSTWIGTPTWLGRLCYSFAPPHLSLIPSLSPPKFLIIIALLGSNLFSESLVKAYRNRLTVDRIHLYIKSVIVTDSDKVSTWGWIRLKEDLMIFPWRSRIPKLEFIWSRDNCCK